MEAIWCVHPFHRIDKRSRSLCQTMTTTPYKQRPAREPRQAHGDGRREHDGLRAGAAAPSTRPVVEDGSRAVGQLSRDLDEAVGVLPATRLENDRGTGTPEDANGDTLSPGLDRSRDLRGRCMKGHARARESDCEARSDDSAARKKRASSGSFRSDGTRSLRRTSHMTAAQHSHPPSIRQERT
jgi:hypothetical protein